MWSLNIDISSTHYNHYHLNGNRESHGMQIFVIIMTKKKECQKYFESAKPKQIISIMYHTNGFCTFGKYSRHFKGHTFLVCADSKQNNKDADLAHLHLTFTESSHN